MTNEELADDITDAVEAFVEAIVAHNELRNSGDLVGLAHLAVNVSEARRALVETIRSSFMLWDFGA